MPHTTTWRSTRPLLATALAAALALLALAAPTAAPAATAAKTADASYVAHAAGGLQLALVVHAGRLEAYATDGRARKAHFAGRARHVLRSRTGDRLTVRLGARAVRATLAFAGAEPLTLIARRARAALFTVTVRPDGAVFGTARGGGVLGAHLSGMGLVGALAFPGHDPKPFAEPAFAHAPLFVDGRAVPYPPERVAEALAGTWRWIVTRDRIVGPITINVNVGITGIPIPAGTMFIDLDSGL